MAKALPVVGKTIEWLIESGSTIPIWVLVSFNNPVVQLVVKTDNVEKLKSELNGLVYSGNETSRPVYPKEQVFRGKCI